MLFIDEAVLRLRAGRGGNGCVSFHRAKFVPRGGPDGGDGGDGGSLVVQGDRNVTSLSDLSLHPTFTAPSGENGGSNKKNGKAGKDLTVRVPVGTEIYDITHTDPRGRLLVDIVDNGQTALVAKGGRGGGGNTRFASGKHRLPHFALHGAPGVFRTVRLSLKLLSDLAIVGLPNAGKSTLLSAITAARPKIADYPFTTLTPNLGVLQSEAASIVLADIPGLVKDAHAGRGLGNVFLKHIERSRALLILLDAAGESIAADYHLLRDEITRFNPQIWDRPRLVVANKLDLLRRPAVKTWSRAIGEGVIGVSAKDGRGIAHLVKKIDLLWAALPAAPPERPETIVLDEAGVSLVPEPDGAMRVVSREWEELASMIPAGNSEALQWFVEKMRAKGVFRVLEKERCPAGSCVRVGSVEIEYSGA